MVDSSDRLGKILVKISQRRFAADKSGHDAGTAVTCITAGGMIG